MIEKFMCLLNFCACMSAATPSTNSTISSLEAEQLSGMEEFFTTEYQPTLIGGREAYKGEFPEVVYIRSTMDGKSANCTATIVSPRVIVTAGHCVSESGEISPAKFDYVDFMVGKQVFTAWCHQAPLYRDSLEDHDLAVCMSDRDLPGPYAKVIHHEQPHIFSDVVLAGYGCTRPGGGGGNDGILRVGEARIITMPYGKNHWFYTKGKTAICFGDSGGPSFLKTRPGEQHVIIGIHSRGNIQDLSLITALFTKESHDFMLNFATHHNVDICGLTTDC